MRICYFADGRYIHALRWMRYFAAKGHEMHLISFAEVGSAQVAELEAQGIKFHGHTGNFHVKKFWLTLRDLRFVRSVLKREKIDILHSHFLGANAWYGALSGFPHIITIMGGGDVNGPDWKPDSNIQERLLTPYSLRNADYVTSWSKLMADVVRPICGAAKPIDVVHGGIQLERFSPGGRPQYLLDRLQIPDDGKIIFSPRLMRPLSNIDKIGAAFKIVLESFPNAFLVIAAPAAERDVDYENALKKTIEQFGGTANVRFVGPVAHDEIADSFRLADVTVSIPDIDGTPMTVLESMACGTPTVIGKLGDYDKEYFENEKTTLMVNVKDSQAIADAILRYLTDTKLAESISNEARKRVEETGSYEFQMEKMDAIYHSVMER